MPKKIAHFINNAPFAGQSQREQAVYDPATGISQTKLALASKADVETAIAAAHKAWPAWSKTPALKRARILDTFKCILQERSETLAKTLSAEHGKTHADALGEIQRGLEIVEFATGAPHLLKGAFSENVGTRIDSHTIRQSLGVCVGITPFNFPAMVPMWMFPIALCCGNSFVLKPSERDPSVSLLLAQWLAEAGLPEGVFNVVQGDKDAVDALIQHPDVKAVSFVGSTPIARSVFETGATHGKRVQALGGAKNHMLIMPDADMDMAATALMGAAFGSAGERCMAISVAVPIGDKTAAALIERLEPQIRSLQIGPACDPASEMGPLITQQHLAKVRSYVDNAQMQGAQIIVDGRDFKQTRPGFEQGYYIGATLLDHVSTNMDCYRDEIFGPVLSMVRTASYQDALDLVHGHACANGTAIFTRDGNTARRFAQDVEVGMVGINVPIPVPAAFHSFGGWKDSLFGDHHMHGMEGIRFYTRQKAVTTRWPSSRRDHAEFSMPILD